MTIIILVVTDSCACAPSTFFSNAAQLRGSIMAAVHVFEEGIMASGTARPVVTFGTYTMSLCMQQHAIQPVWMLW